VKDLPKLSLLATLATSALPVLTHAQQGAKANFGEH
jgi:hypothetical protein